jgi:hypothetical protein
MALIEDLGRQALPVGEKNIAFKRDDIGYRARGVVVLDRFGKQSIPQVGAFGEALVAELTPILQQSFEYTVDNTFLTENTEVGGGTVTQATGLAIVTTSTTTGSSALLQSGRHGRYRAGQGILLRMTGLFSNGVTGTEQYIGLADVIGSSAAFKNGFMIGYDGSDFGVHRFQGDSKTTVNLTDCDDPLDGSGASGMVIDTTKINVFGIRFQYLGAGAIEYLVEDDSTGKLIPFHTVFYANNELTPSVYNPNFHVMLWAANKGTTANIVTKTASFGYFVEGVSPVKNLQQPQFSTSLQQKTTVTTEVAILTIRNKSIYASVSNFMDIQLEQVVSQIEANSANNLGYIRLVRNATLGGAPSYTDINATNSVVEIDVSGTTVTGGEEVMVIPLAGKNDKEIIDLTPFEIYVKHNDTITVSGVSANSATIEASLLWKELF